MVNNLPLLSKLIEKAGKQPSTLIKADSKSWQTKIPLLSKLIKKAGKQPSAPIKTNKIAGQQPSIPIKADGKRWQTNFRSYQN